MKKVHLVYFSPSGTTKKVVTSIVKGMGSVEVIHHDMLKPESRKQAINFSKDDLVIFGILTAVKMLGPLKEIINCLNGNDTPVVGITMFGNEAYGPTLRDFKKVIEKRGFKMVAGGAFIGQHSMTKNIATGRPDESDIQIAKDFGQRIYDKVYLKQDLSFENILPIDIQDKFGSLLTQMMTYSFAFAPIKAVTLPKILNKRTIAETCIECKRCESNCPMNAIDISAKSINVKSCIGCFGCQNICGTDSITSTNKLLESMIKGKEDAGYDRREPEIFI